MYVPLVIGRRPRLFHVIFLRKFSLVPTLARSLLRRLFLIAAYSRSPLCIACEKYKRFYLHQHSGHKLEWRMDQGQAEIQVDFAAAMRRGLIVTTYQMMIFLVFNSAKIVTFKQILDITGKR
jgi:hypothetical protein